MATKGFDATVSITTSKRKDLEAQTENLHAKTFGAWVNSRLTKAKYDPIQDLNQDLRNGIALIHLAEALCGTKTDKKINTNPTTEIHKIENVAIAIEMLKAKDPTIQINSKDITDGNRKLTLGLIWRLIQENQMLSPGDIEKSTTQRNKLAKGNLVEFVKKQTASFAEVKVNDLVESFYDGLAFCAIVHKLKPEALNWETVKTEEPKVRLQKAFEVAEREFNIPKLLDPEDMVKENADMRPDEKCLMTYISEFPLALLRQEELAQAEKEKNLEYLLQQEKERQKERESERQSQKEKEEELIRQKELEAEALRSETQDLKAQHDELKKQALSRKEDLKTQNDTLLEDNKRIMEEIARIKEENEKLQKNLQNTKNKLIAKLNITVKEAKDIAVTKLGGKSDPYLKLKLEAQEFKTKVKKKTICPKWEQEFEFFVTEKQCVLEISMFDWDRFTSDSFMGKVAINIGELKDGTNETKWFPFFDSDLEEQTKGELLLNLTYKLGK